MYRQRVTVEIDPDLFGRLQTLALRERRGTRDQASVILEDVLRRLTADDGDQVTPLTLAGASTG